MATINFSDGSSFTGTVAECMAARAANAGAANRGRPKGNTKVSNAAKRPGRPSKQNGQGFALSTEFEFSEVVNTAKGPVLLFTTKDKVKKDIVESLLSDGWENPTVLGWKPANRVASMRSGELKTAIREFLKATGADNCWFCW